jgi:hypothetical protein
MPELAAPLSVYDGNSTAIQGKISAPPPLSPPNPFLGVQIGKFPSSFNPDRNPGPKPDPSSGASNNYQLALQNRRDLILKQLRTNFIMATSATMASFSLEGQTAVVTGGTRGIGQAVAVSLAECGADIILIQVHFPPLPQLYKHSKEIFVQMLTFTARPLKHSYPKGRRSSRLQSNHLHRRPLFPR